MYIVHLLYNFDKQEQLEQMPMNVNTVFGPVLATYLQSD
jgi:hypothetical protein